MAADLPLAGPDHDHAEKPYFVMLSTAERKQVLAEYDAFDERVPLWKCRVCGAFTWSH